MPNDSEQPDFVLSPAAMAAWGKPRPMAAAQTEAPNCFSFAYTKGLEVGIELVFNHPAVPEGYRDSPMVFVGGLRWIPRNFKDGYNYKKGYMKDIGWVKRASFEKIERPGQSAVLVLSSKKGDDYLLHVSSDLPETVTPKVRFNNGVSVADGAEILVRKLGEALVNVPKKGTVDVYFGDGSVLRILRRDYWIETEKLSILEMGLSRLRWAKESLAWVGNDSTLDDDTRAKRRDAILHQVVTIIQIGGKLPQITGIGHDILMGMVAKGLMNYGVQIRAVEALNLHDRTYATELEQACSAKLEASRSGGGFGNVGAVTAKAITAKQAASAKRQKREAEQRKNQLARAAASLNKGPSGSKPSYNSGKKPKNKR